VCQALQDHVTDARVVQIVKALADLQGPLPLQITPEPNAGRLESLHLPVSCQSRASWLS
jgi:hypothetical protein